MFAVADTPNQLSNSRRPRPLPYIHLPPPSSLSSVNRKNGQFKFAVGEMARRSTRSPHKHVLTLENGAADQTLAPEGGGGAMGVNVAGGWRQFREKHRILNRNHTWIKCQFLGKLLRFFHLRKFDVA